MKKNDLSSVSGDFKKFSQYLNIIRLIDENTSIIKDNEFTDFIYSLKDNFEEIDRTINRITYIDYSIKNNIENLMFLIRHLEPRFLNRGRNPINTIDSNIEITKEQIKDIKLKINKEINRLIILKNSSDLLHDKVRRTKKYDVFISYYRWSGRDIAVFVREAFESEGINAFIDVYDIPKTIKTFSDEWRKYIDNSIVNANYFLLIMTKGFEKRKELLREIKIATKNNINFVFFKYETLPYDIKVKIDGEIIDFSDYQVNTFQTPEELFRKILDIIA